MRKLIIIAALVVPVTALLAVASPAQAATPKERNLARQVQTLKAQVKTLKTQNTRLKTRVTTLETQNTTLTNERNSLAADKTALSGQVSALNASATLQRDICQRQVDTLSGQLATAQQGAVATLGTMSESDLYFNALPVISKVFDGGSSKYTSSHFTSSDWSEWSFDYWR
jgi:septal ring factor EnvC (AmiA/AmiB activator)